MYVHTRVCKLLRVLFLFCLGFYFLLCFWVRGDERADLFGGFGWFDVIFVMLC